MKMRSYFIATENPLARCRAHFSRVRGLVAGCEKIMLFHVKLLTEQCKILQSSANLLITITVIQDSRTLKQHSRVA